MTGKQIVALIFIVSIFTTICVGLITESKQPKQENICQGIVNEMWKHEDRSKEHKRLSEKYFKSHCDKIYTGISFNPYGI